MILTLCGSARFEGYFHEANKQLGLAGHICFSLMTFPSIEGEKTWYTEDEKWTLDLAHFAKIEASSGIVLLNVDGYLGESSLRELKWARMRDKKIFWCFSDSRKTVGESFAQSLISGMNGWSNWTELTDAVNSKQRKQQQESES